MPKKEQMGFQWVLHEFEHFTDDIIPVLVVLLAIVLIVENPFWTLVHLENYAPWPTVFDMTVLFFFITDLLFKWFKTRNIRKFFRLYWLDLIAVFPFYLAFRAYAEIAAIFKVSEQISETGQKLAHEAVLLREARLLEQGEKLGKETKNIRTFARLLRVLKGRFYTSHRALVAVHEAHRREHRDGN